MSKIRVHELAKELNKGSKDVIYALKGHGVDVESHMSTISSENADKIRKFFTQPAAKPAQKQETKPAQDNRNAAPRRNNNVQVVWTAAVITAHHQEQWQPRRARTGVITAWSE